MCACIINIWDILDKIRKRLCWPSIFKFFISACMRKQTSNMHATIAQSYEEVECPPLLEKVLYDHMDNREDFIEISKIEPFTKLPLRLVPEKGSKLHPPLFMYGWYADRDKLLDYAALNGLTAAVDEKKSKKEKKGKGGRKGKEGKETANEDHSSTQQSHNAESTRTAPRRRKSSVHDREFMQKAIVDLLGKHQLGDYSNNVELHNTLYKALGHDSSVIITLFTNYSLDKELAFETVDAIQKALEAPEGCRCRWYISTKYVAWNEDANKGIAERNYEGK